MSWARKAADGRRLAIAAVWGRGGAIGTSARLCAAALVAPSPAARRIGRTGAECARPADGILILPATAIAASCPGFGRSGRHRDNIASGVPNLVLTRLHHDGLDLALAWSAGRNVLRRHCNHWAFSGSFGQNGAN